MIGDPLSLTCKVNEATLEIKWKKDGASEIPRAEIFPIRDESTLFISKVVTSDSGEYSCEAHNRAGIASSTLKINVRGKIRIYYCGQLMLILYLARIFVVFLCTN